MTLTFVLQGHVLQAISKNPVLKFLQTCFNLLLSSNILGYYYVVQVAPPGKQILITSTPLTVAKSDQYLSFLTYTSMIILSNDVQHSVPLTTGHQGPPQKTILHSKESHKYW